MSEISSKTPLEEPLLKMKSAKQLADMLNLKEEYDFGNVAYLDTETISVLLYNDSDQQMDISFISSNMDFSVVPQSLELKRQQTMTVQLECKPRVNGELKSNVEIVINQTPASTIRLIAQTYQLAVDISPPDLTGFKETLITQTSAEQTVLTNISERPIKYRIMQYPTEMEGEDPLYEDPNFEVGLLSGVVYPNAKINIQVHFTPTVSGLNTSTLWIECSGRFERIPVQLRALGVSPNVELDVDVLEYTNITLGASSVQRFQIINHSTIEAEFEIVPRSEEEIESENCMLEFSQEEGNIPPQSALDIDLVVTPLFLGEYTNFARFQVVGGQEPLLLEVKTIAVPPTVQLISNIDDVTNQLEKIKTEEVLDFGITPYGFGQSQEVTLKNTSIVAQEFVVKVEPPEDSSIKEEQLTVEHDFTVTPSILLLEPNEQREVCVTLLPKHADSLASYRNFRLNVYNKCEQQPLAACAVHATVVNAAFRVSPATIDLPEAFVGYEHKIELNIENTSRVVGRWLFTQQDMADACLITSDLSTGVIAAGKSETLNISLIPRRPGALVVAIKFLADAGDAGDLETIVEYDAKGPQIKLSHEFLKFESGRVLEPKMSSFMITNIGLSKCKLRFAANKPKSFFTIKEGFEDIILDSNESKQIEVDFLANEAGVHKDQLLISSELTDMACDIADEVLKEVSMIQKIRLEGEAKGTPLVCPDENLAENDVVDCGQFFTTEQLVKVLRIENHGPEEMTLNWAPASTKADAGNLLQCSNNKIALKTGEYCDFEFTAKSKKALYKSEEWLLRANVAGKSTDVAFTVNFEYRFVQSQIAISLVNEDNTESVIDIGKQCEPLEFLYEEFPVFGPIEEFFDEDNEHKIGYCAETEDGESLYINAQTLKVIKIQNMTQLNSRLQVIVERPFFVRLIDEKGNFIDSSDALDELNETDFGIDELKRPSSRTQVSGKSFESFLLTEEQSFQYMQIGIEESFVQENKISKNIDGNVIIRLLPPEQNPVNVPTIKLPVQCTVQFPSCDYGFCSLREFQEYENVDFNKFFDKLEKSSSIDFGSTVPGTPINKFIYVKNISAYPIQFSWEINNFRLKNCQFDISPSGIIGDEGLLPQQIAMFKCIFTCDAGEESTMKVEDVAIVCNVLGGPINQFTISAQISNLAVDVLPSHFQLDEIQYNTDTTQTLIIQNQSDVNTTVQLKTNIECLPFIKKINSNTPTSNIEVFDLKGFQKLEIPMVFAPKVPGRFHIPLFIKIGHLEEIMVPVQGIAYIEQVNLLTPENTILARSEEVVPWDVKDHEFKPFSAFLRAAYTMESKVQQMDLNYSSLEKIVNDDGSINVNGQHYDALMDEKIEELAQNPIYLQLAETLIMTAIERYKGQNIEVSNRVVSKARNRTDSEEPGPYVNNHNYAVMRTEARLPKYMTMFNCVIDMPSCERGVTSSVSVVLKNTGTVPVEVSFDKKYFFSYGVNVEPERIVRLPPGDETEITITYQPASDAAPQQIYLLPVLFKSNTIGFIELNVTVSTPTIKVTNLLNLIENFESVKIKEQDCQILHFGECKFGRQLKFGLNIDNPTSLEVNFSCDISGGAIGVWDGKEIDLKAKIETKSPELFRLESTPQQSIMPLQESILNVAFTPEPLIDVEVGDRLTFVGILKLNVKTATGGFSSELIYLVGLGYYPALSLNQKNLILPAVFPGQVAETINAVEVTNNDSKPLEVYIEQFDDVWRIERLVLDSLAQLEGVRSVVKKGKQQDIFYTLNIPSIADAGEMLSKNFEERLEAEGFGRLMAFLKKRYSELHSGAEAIKSFIASKEAVPEVEKGRPKSGKKGVPPVEPEDNQENAETEEKPELPAAELASELLMAEKQAERLKELNCEISNDDFTYALTESETAAIGYQKSCFTVINDRSYRINHDDVYFSNIPFLTFIISGAPLSGKSGLCRRIEENFMLNGKQMPILNIDVLLCNSEVEKKYLELKEKEEEEEASGKGKAAPKKGEAPPVDYTDYKNIPEYIEEISAELVSKIEQLFETDESLLKIGCVFDQPENNQFLMTPEALNVFFKLYLQKFNKPTLYDKQVATSRHAVFPIILDVSPLCARKRAMEEIISEYKEAEAELQQVEAQNHGLNINKEELEAAQLRIELAKTAMVDAKQYYDIEFQNHEKEEQIPHDDFVICFNKVYCDEDILGQGQAKYLENAKELIDVYSRLKETIVEMHKQLLAENKPPTEKSELETQIDAIQAEMDELEEEMSKQKNKAQLKIQEDKYDELQAQITELREKLPPNPVDLLPELNLFQKHVIEVEDHPNMSQLDQIFNKYITPFRNYAKVLKETQIFKENPHYTEITCVREFQVYKTENPMPVNELKQILEANDENNDIIKILDEKQSLKAVLNTAYENLDTENEVYEMLTANSHYIDYFKSVEAKIETIEAEIDELEGPPPADKNAKVPPKSKEQLAEIANKEKEIQHLQSIMSAESLFGPATEDEEYGLARYVIPPGQKQNIYFRLLANEIKVDQSMDLTLKSRTTMFEQQFEVVSTCDWPHIVPELINVKNNLIDFGFLRSNVMIPEPFTRDVEEADGFDYSMDYKKFSETMQQKVNNFVELHTRELLIENDSKYTVQVAIVLGDGETPAEELQKQAFSGAVDAGAKGGAKAPPPKKGGKDTGTQAQCFEVYPSNVTLAPGHKQYVFVTAFPEEDSEITQELFVFTEHNPSFQELTLKCIGCQPAAEVTIPECEQDLMPCGSLAAEINDLQTAINGLLNPDEEVDPKAKKAPPAKGAPVEVSKNMLNIQRTAIAQTQSQEVVIKNTSDLELYVLFDLAASAATEEIAEKLELKGEDRKFTYTNNVPKKQDKDQTIYYDMSNKYLQIKNYKFVLLPQEERKIVFHFQAPDVQQVVVPGSLQIFEINKKYAPVECQLEHFGEFAKTYGKPILAQPLVVVAESSKVEVVTEFIGVLTKSEDIIPPKDNLSAGGFVNFGTVKAMLHFQAEFNLENIGKYDVRVNAAIRKAYVGTVTFCEEGPKDPKAKGDVPVEMKDELEFVLGPGAPVAAADAAKDKKAAAAAPANNTRSIVIDYYSQRGLERSPFADLVLSDAASGIVLEKLQLHGTAKCAYASLSITPDRSLYFGDITSGRSVTRNITLENTGEFAMEVKVKDVQTSIMDFLNPPTEAAAAPADRKTPAKGVAPPAAESLVINQFSITPTAFSLSPGEKQQIAMTFNSLGTKEHKEYFVIEYSNRNPKQGSNYALPDAYMKRVIEEIKLEKEDFNINQLVNYEACNYGISGYSQVPGIKPDLNELYEEEQIVNQAEPDPTLLTGISEYSINANEINFGAVQLNSFKYERVKLYNPFNVECQFVAFLTQQVENVSSVDLINEVLGTSLEQVLEYVEAAPTSSRPATGKKAAAPAKGGKGAETEGGDASYWTLNKAVVKIPPRDSAYFTIGFKPDEQKESESRLIATSIDTWLRVQEQMEAAGAAAGGKGGKADPNAEKTILTNLTQCMTENDKKAALIDVRLIGAGVMPEVRVKPQCIELDDHMVGYSDIFKNKEAVTITNVGRIACSVSLQIKAEGGADQFFTFLKSDRCSKSPENRLFTGLIKLQPEESYEVDVALSEQVNVLRQNQELQATVVAKILLAGGDSNGVDIPVNASVIVSPLCIEQKTIVAELKETFIEHATQCLFEIPDGPGLELAIEQILKAIGNSNAYTSVKSAYLQTAGVLNEDPLYSVNVFLTDVAAIDTPMEENKTDATRGASAATERPQHATFTELELFNQSNSVERYDLNSEQLKRLGIYASPAVGHINPGNKVKIQLCLTKPAEQPADPKAKGKPGVSRTVLFGTPLMVKITPIQLQRPRQQAWNDTLEQVNYVTDENSTAERVVERVEEPEYTILVDQSEVERLRGEYDEIAATAKDPKAKAKLTPQQEARFGSLQKIFEENDTSSIASNLLQLNVFGTYAPQAIKLKYENTETKEYQDVVPDAEGVIELPLSEVPILQSSNADMKVLNDGICCPVLKFVNEQSSGAVTVTCAEIATGRPDLLAAAVKETYTAITDIPSLQALFTKLGLGGKGADKNAGAQMEEKYTNVDTSPFAVGLRVQFKPIVPGSYQELFTAPGLPLSLLVSAGATLPICHVEGAPSRYLEEIRPSQEPTPLMFANLMASAAKSIKVIQIGAVGVNQESQEVLTIVNTINATYEIQLTRLVESSEKISCDFVSYTIVSGEKVEVRFGYTPDRSSFKTLSEEAFYVLRIPAYEVQIPILVAGVASEPKVTLSTNKAHFGRVELRGTREMDVKIINEETQSYNWKIDVPNTLKNTITVRPTAGIVPAKGESCLVVMCEPKTEENGAAPITINVAKKSVPLLLNVKYECAKPRYTLQLIPEEEMGLSQIISGKDVEVNFGRVFVADSARRRFKLTNVGQAPMNFSATLRLNRIVSTERRNKMELEQVEHNMVILVQREVGKSAMDGSENLEMSVSEGSGGLYDLQPQESCFIDVTFKPREVLDITKEFGLELDVHTIGLQHEFINLVAKSVRPGLQANVQQLNFPTQLANLIPEKCNTETITLTNYDKQPLNVEFNSETDEFCIVTEPVVEPLLPGRKLDIVVRFQPLYPQKYTGELNVVVNGLYKLRYTLTGTAVECNITIDKNIITFGSVLINEERVFKQTVIRNRSAAPLTLDLAFAPETDINGLFMTVCELEEQQELTTKIMDQLNNWNDKPVKKKYLANLNHKIQLEPNGQVAMLLFYAPLQRNIEFQGIIDAKVDECLDFPGICKVMGSGIGAKLKLTQKSLDMPICMEGSYVISQFQIENSGDMPINYVLTLPPKNLVKRDIVKMFENHVIQIYPQTATVEPGKILDVQVKFNPPAGFGARKFTLQNLPVDFIDAQGVVQPVGTINISFTCESNKSFSAVETHEVSFECPARSVEHRTLRIENSTPANFEVKTVLQGPGARHFVVPERLVVPPGGCTFEVQFRPMEVARAPPAPKAPAVEAVEENTSKKPESAKGGKKPTEAVPAAPAAEVPAHKALLIVASPEGGAIKYELIGVATEPVLDGMVFNKIAAPEEAPAKGKAPAKGAPPVEEDPAAIEALHEIDLSGQEVVAYRTTTFTIPAYNWEKTMQRFQISFHYDDPAMETLSRFIAPEFVDVSPGANRDVEIKFVPYALQTFTGVIELVNKKTEQSLRFKFNISCQENKPIETHMLETVVRDDVSKHFTLQNVPKQTCTLELKSSTKEVTFQKSMLQILNHQIGVPVAITYLPMLPCERQEQTIEVEVTNNKGEKLAKYIIQLFLTANPPRPGSPVHIRSEVGKPASFEIACKNYSAEKGQLSVAMASISDVQAIYSYLEENAAGAAAAKGGKGGPSICDNKTLFPTLNGFEPTAADVSAEANQNYICNFQFTPTAPGSYQASAVMYGPNVGLWVVPVIGTCDRVAGTGSIAFEQ